MLYLKEKVEYIAKIVSEVGDRVVNIPMPTKEGTKKGRRVKQNMTPSPFQHQVENHERDDDPQTMAERKERENSEDEYEITTEEILVGKKIRYLQVSEDRDRKSIQVQ